MRWQFSFLFYYSYYYYKPEVGRTSPAFVGLLVEIERLNGLLKNLKELTKTVPSAIAERIDD